MKIAALIPSALVLTVAALGLYVTGLATPYWFHAHKLKDRYSFHYGVFVICQMPGDCHFWMTLKNKLSSSYKQQSHKELNPSAPVKAGTGVSGIILCLNCICLVETGAILTWYIAMKSSKYWAHNAWMCNLSGLGYGIGGTAIFIGVRMSHDEHKESIAWSAILVFLALSCQMLSAVFIRVSLGFGEGNLQDIKSPLPSTPTAPSLRPSP